MRSVQLLLNVLLVAFCPSLDKVEASSLLWRWNDSRSVNTLRYEISEITIDDDARRIVMHLEYKGFVKDNNVEILNKALDIDEDYIVTVRWSRDGTALVKIDGFTEAMSGVNNLCIHTPLQKPTKEPVPIDIYIITLNPENDDVIPIGAETSVEQLERLKQKGQLLYFPVYSKLIENTNSVPAGHP